MRLKDRVAIVTGAGSGLGKGIALRFAEEGARVVCADIAGDTAEETARAISQSAGKALARMLCQAVFAAEPEEISFLSFLWYVHGGGGPFRIADVDTGVRGRIRAARHHGLQRRDGEDGDLSRDHPGAVSQHYAAERRGALVLWPVCRAGDVRARLWPHYQYCLDCRGARGVRPHELWHFQGSGDRVDPADGLGAGAAGNHRKCHWSWSRRHPVIPRRAQRGG